MPLPFGPVCAGTEPLVTRDFWPSFKNVAFEVEEDSIETGRRAVIHQYPSGEFWDNEDLGRKAFLVEVSAYIHGDDVQRWAGALVAACSAPGPGQLILPMRRPARALCLACKSTYLEDERGRISFELAFVLEPPSPPLSLSPVSLVDLTGAAVRAARAAQVQNEARVTSQYNAVGQFSVARDAAIIAISDAAIALAAARAGMRLSREASARVSFTAERMRTDAGSYAFAGKKPYEASGDAFVGDEASPPLVFASEFAAAVETLRAGAQDPAGLARELYDLAVFAASAITNTIIVASVEAERKLTGEISGYVRRTALLALARTVVAVKYSARGEAAAARAKLAAAISAELEVVDDDPLADALAAVRDAAVAALTRAGAELPPVIQLELRTASPAAVVATEYYGDSGRTDEIVARNHIANPLFCPLGLELLKR